MVKCKGVGTIIMYLRLKWCKYLDFSSPSLNLKHNWATFNHDPHRNHIKLTQQQNWDIYIYNSSQSIIVQETFTNTSWGLSISAAPKHPLPATVSLGHPESGGKWN